MKCDRCGEYATDQVYPLYKRETGEKTFLCYHCWYDIVERESDIEYKKMLREIADECHNKRTKEPPKEPKNHQKNQRTTKRTKEPPKEPPKHIKRRINNGTRTLDNRRRMVGCIHLFEM